MRPNNINYLKITFGQELDEHIAITPANRYATGKHEMRRII